MKPLPPPPRLLLLFLAITLILPLLLLLTRPQLRPLILQPPIPFPHQQDLSSSLTIGIKTYVCDSPTLSQLITLVRTIRLAHRTIPILLANDGPLPLSSYSDILRDPYTTELHSPIDSGISYGRNMMVNATTTPFFMLLDDDHLYSLDGTDLSRLLRAISDFDIVGIRIQNSPGIPELEDAGVYIPRYISNITRFENRRVELCVWDENVGPSVIRMNRPMRVDVLHNAFLARTDVLKRNPWRNELKVNEHMTFFLDAKANKLRVGYLPSLYVWHRSRRFSQCYERVRRREDKFERLLDYKDDYLWTKGCYESMVQYAKWHLTQEDENTVGDEEDMGDR